MIKSTELTKAGKLEEATALIQSLIRGGEEPHAAMTDTAMEGVFIRLVSPAHEQPAQSKPDRRAGRTGGAGSGLGETLRRLAAGGMPGQAAVVRRPIGLPTARAFWH